MGCTFGFRHKYPSSHFTLAGVHELTSALLHHEARLGCVRSAGRGDGERSRGGCGWNRRPHIIGAAVGNRHRRNAAELDGGRQQVFLRRKKNGVSRSVLIIRFSKFVSRTLFNGAILKGRVTLL